MRETRVDLLHLLEDLRDAYPEAVEETIVTEIVANALDSTATEIRVRVDPAGPTLTVVDNGTGMQRRDLARYHDLGATTKTRGAGIGFAGVGIKLGLLEAEEVYTETARGRTHIATAWHLSSRRRAPWQYVEPLGLVVGSGTAVQLRLANALSPLVDPDYVATCLLRHFEPLFDQHFNEILSGQYPDGVRFLLNGSTLTDGEPEDAGERATVDVRLPRKRKPSAYGYLVQRERPAAEGNRGLAVSTLGKVILRGWDWIGVSPADPERVTGLIEAPALAESLTLNKADFLRTGSSGAQYLAYRKAIQEVVARQFAEWGVDRDAAQREPRRAARPVERELESILMDLSDAYPILPTLVEHRAGGQRRLPIGIPDEDAAASVPITGPTPHESSAPGTTNTVSAEPASARPPEPTVPPATLTDSGRRGPRKRTKYRLNVQFESRPEDPELARIVEATIWINDAHPAYTRAVASRSTGYHIALGTALALARHAVEPEREHEFVTAFLARWGKGSGERGAGKGKRRARRSTRRRGKDGDAGE